MLSIYYNKADSASIFSFENLDVSVSLLMRNNETAHYSFPESHTALEIIFFYLYTGILVLVISVQVSCVFLESILHRHMPKIAFPNKQIVTLYFLIYTRIQCLTKHGHKAWDISLCFVYLFLLFVLVLSVCLSFVKSVSKHFEALDSVIITLRTNKQIV